ncbi:MAG: TRAP transporter large permease [Candidatus Nitronauta litoralis]|uniref:TRAP transporter large permease n=1 Tax=Candidatus Nitronauta litoralis TaxID=2705533 RepID=A0A7T0BZ87_9BACT|nr:MAG: TRAP transporter large permease [Candidatus Nitronauta litoralis]
MTLAITGGLVLLALVGTPLYAIIGALALILFFLADIESAAVFIELYRVTSQPSLIAIPLFTFAGFLMAESGTPKRLTRLTETFLGALPGGTPLVALVACGFFTAFTGASGVTIIALGGLLYPMLIREHYSRKFSLGLLTASGSLGLLFPPSLPLILYGLIAQVNIDQLFLAGIIPGIFLILIFFCYSFAMGKKLKIPITPFNRREAWSAIKQARWEIPLPFLILWGIYGGFITVTEAAAVTVVYVLLVETVLYKDLNLLSDVPRIMKTSMVLVGSILIILGTALGFTSYLVDEQVPMQILEAMGTYIDDKITFLIVLNIFLLIVGCLMDIFSAIIVVVPLIVPIAQSFGVDMVHLGIIFLTNLEIGYMTPPVGINLFLSSSRFNEPVLKMYQASLPFLGLMLIGLMLITYFPELSLWLVHTFQ